MKHLITVLTLITCISTFCQNTFVPDDNFELALIEFGYDTAPLDNYVPTKNIVTVTGLDISNRNIKDLTGIEDFVILKSLQCNNNQLTSLDISKNLELRHLDCSDNLIRNLNLAQNEFLTVISCNNNQLSQLDLQHNGRLNYLECNNNLLSSMNVQKDNDLVSIACSDNLLRELDVSQNLELKYLNCSNNKLSELFVDNNLKLRNLNIEKNSISSISLLQNIELLSFNCSLNGMTVLDFSKNLELVTLNISTNQIETLNLSQNLKISRIDGHDNKLTSIDLSNHEYISFLDVSSNELCGLNIKNGSNSSITSLNFDATSNPNLSCILVDDINFSTSNWTQRDSNVSFVTSQEECQVLGNFSVLVDHLEDMSPCNFFILPPLTYGNYYTENNGLGDLLHSGEIISESMRLYIYNENTCGTNESSFLITITENNVLDAMEDVESCGYYSLPPLQNGDYYTQPGGLGTTLQPGDTVSSSKTIFVYAESENLDECPSEISFSVIIHPTVEYELQQNHIEIKEQTIFVNIEQPLAKLLYSIDDLIYQEDPYFHNLSEGMHQLYVKDVNGCSIKTISFTIQIGYEIPTFFTPNNDGINDNWNVLDFSNTIKTISIFNRYGKHLKNIIPNSEGWDGNSNGFAANADNYWYLISFRSGEVLQGNFVLKR